MNPLHLNCHFYPRRGGQWRRTVRHLLQRECQFTGKRIIGISISEDTDSADDVRDAFGDFQADFIVVQNSHLQEIETFMPCLERVIDQPGVLFRCHSKSCTHPKGSASEAWGDLSFSLCLDWPDFTSAVLEKYPICGPFRSTMPFMIPTPFHFAGSLWLVRLEALRRRNWRAVHNVFWGAESYPGVQFAHDESASIFFDCAQTADLYGLDFWRDKIIPLYRRWVKTVRACGYEGHPWFPPDSQINKWLKPKSLLGMLLHAS